MSELRQLKRQTRDLLTGLGTGPDEVAATLEAAGVHGVPRDNRSCAVALYMSALMGSDPRVRSVKVGHCSLFLDTAAPPEFRPSGRLLVQLPKPVRQFVAAFDSRAYPTVIRPAPGEGSPCPQDRDSSSAPSDRIRSRLAE
jgi:hypothetical protein